MSIRIANLFKCHQKKQSFFWIVISWKIIRSIWMVAMQKTKQFQMRAKMGDLDAVDNDDSVEFLG